MTSTFFDRLDVLRELTGADKGDLVSSVVVDQVYAHAQHAHLEWHHPRGGGALYLQKPLMRAYRRYLQRYADTLLRDGGVPAMIRAAEALAESEGVATSAPVELGDLRASGHPRVFDGHEQVYDRAPRMHRLDKAELKGKSRAVMALRKMLGEPIFWMSHGKIMVEPGSGGPLNVITRGRRA